MALLGRAVLSLLLITGLILVTYAVIKRSRTRKGTMPARPSRAATKSASSRTAPTGRTSRRAQRQQLVVLSRVATSRTSSISAVQFGDKVLLVGTTDAAATQVLAEMPLREWDVIETQETSALPLSTAGAQGETLSVDAIGPQRTPVGHFVEALRTATARHA